MARSIKKLESISLVSPCASDWDEMAGDEQVRFCTQCDKHVFNLSAMSRRQAEEIITRVEGRLCARFVQLPGGTILTTDETAYRKHAGAYRRAPQRLLGAAFVMLFSLAASAFAQSSTQSCEPSPQSAQYQIKRADRQSETKESKLTATLHGTIYDIESAAIADAKINLINETTRQEFAATTGEDGTFVFPSLESGTYTFNAASLGFATFKKTALKLKAGEDVRLDATLMVGSMGGIAIIEQQSALKQFSNALLLPYRGVKKLITSLPR